MAAERKSPSPGKREKPPSLEKAGPAGKSHQLKPDEQLLIFRKFADASEQGLGMADLDGRIIYVNMALCRILGHQRPEDAYRTNVREYYLKEDAIRLANEILPAVMDQGYQTVEIPLVSAGNHVTAVIQSIFLIRDDHGQPLCFANVITDITERKHVEDELHRHRDHLEEDLLKSEQKFRAIFDRASDGILIADVETRRFILGNQTMCRMLGYSPDEVTRLGLTDIHPREDLDSVVEKFEKLTAGEIPFAFDVPVIKKDGTVFFADINTFNINIGRNKCLAGIFRDITDRKRMEKELKESEELYRSVYDTAPLAFVVWDRETRVTGWNDRAESMFGWTREEIAGRSFFDFIIPEFARDHVGEVVRLLLEGRLPSHSINENVTRSGRTILCEWNNAIIRDAGGNITGVLSLASDITESRKMEEQLRQAQRLDSIGTLAGGIAHDFNNLLQAIFGNITLARMNLDMPERATGLLANTEAALHTAVNLTTQLLTFSKGGQPVKRHIRPAPVVENTIRFSLSGSGTDYRLSAADDLWMVNADEGQLSQVIQNIVLNAGDAMAGSGMVHVSLSNMDNTSEAMRMLPEKDRYVRIDIRDTGIGIPGENISKIFDPYFTTKQRGSGLGLATTYSIIRNHGGIIEVESEVGRGTTFSLYLPAAGDEATIPETPYRRSDSSRKGRILLMDDEETVRTVAGAMIASLGHEIECVSDGMTAIEVYREARETGDPFDLVILDLTIKGGMGGEEAIAILRREYSDIVAVVSSGYADNTVISRHRDFGFKAFLNKPYSLDSLKTCLRSLI